MKDYRQIKHRLTKEEQAWQELWRLLERRENRQQG